MKSLHIARNLFTVVLFLQFAHVSAQGKSKTTVKTDESIRPFKVAVSDADLNDLRSRLKATKWLAKEHVSTETKY